VFSLHFEHEWSRVVDTILKYYDETEQDFFVNVMAHHDKMDHVRSVVKKFKNWAFDMLFVEYDGLREIITCLTICRYNGNDLQWILEQDATVKPNCRIDDDKIMHANDVIKLHQNQFKGWTCNAGLESLMINWDGDVHRATCRVGDSLGNIFQDEFSVPTTPITCTREWCTCAADIPLTKIKND